MATNVVASKVSEPAKIVGALLTSNITTMGFEYEFEITPQEMEILEIDRRTDIEKAKAATLFIEQSLKDYSKWMKR